MSEKNKIMLRIKNISKSFDSLDVLDNINLSIRRNEFFTLLGPSGCGKTTLLRILAGLEEATSGEILLDEQMIDYRNLKTRPFNMVFQKYALFPHMSVYENVAFGLKTKKVDPQSIPSRVKEALELVRLQNYSERFPGTLSGGEQQRVALARALVNRPQILLLDESLSALDYKLRQQMQLELCLLQRKLNITFIFVTHDQEEAMRLSDRIAIMNQGKIEQVGRPEEIYENPRSTFVANFIGMMNSFPGIIQSENEKEFSIKISGKENLFHSQKYHNDPDATPSFKTGDQVNYMVRPENIEIFSSRSTKNINTITGSIKEILYKGQLTEIVVEPSEATLPPIHVTKPNGNHILQQFNFSVGSKLKIAWDPCHAFVLNTHENN